MAAMSGSVTDGVLSSSSELMSFSDQGQNLAGIFFQASLLPYLAFLYFLRFRGNRTPALGNFGWQFLLLFVLSTIPSGIITKGNYGESLADCDWLHGSAEALLTITNLLIVAGFRAASTGEESTDMKPRYAAIAAAVTFFGACFTFPNFGVAAHSPFLFGIGGLSTDLVQSMDFLTHAEPVNALSVPTWAIHFSSVFEFLFAMGVIWKFADVTGNPKWRGLTWGMLPLHASGIAACTYHFFYNDSSLQGVVTSQAGFTLLGNITVAIAAYRIAVSNGWTLNELNPFPKSNTSTSGIIVDEVIQQPLNTIEAESETLLIGKLLGLTLVTSYLVKYGELALNLPFEPNGFAAAAMILTPPAITAGVFYNKSKEEGGEGLSFPSFGGEASLSMTDVKKYGVAGTVAYVLTELAFWAVAFPVASTLYYNTAGHWPDVINDASDRNTVLGFIFAGANIARLAVPLRLGAAIALAPWVDQNIINRNDDPQEQ